MGDPATRPPRWTAGRIAAGAGLTLVLVPVAFVAFFGVVLGGCAEECSPDSSRLIPLTVAAAVVVLGTFVLGLVGLRRWSWTMFVLYIVALVMLARLAEFTLTRL